MNYRRLASHADRIQKHLAFHIEVTEVARAVNAQQIDAADGVLNASTPYAKASRALNVSFLQLRKEAGI